MSRCDPGETRVADEKGGAGLGGNVLRPAPTLSPKARVGTRRAALLPPVQPS